MERVATEERASVAFQKSIATDVRAESVDLEVAWGRRGGRPEFAMDIMEGADAVEGARPEFAVE